MDLFLNLIRGFPWPLQTVSPVFPEEPLLLSWDFMMNSSVPFMS